MEKNVNYLLGFKTCIILLMKFNGNTLKNI